jgi:hypothetical protein
MGMVAETKDETGRAPWDYFSWGHVAMGIMSFLLLVLINIIPTYVDQALVYIIPYWLMLVLTICVGIGWEIIENTIFVKWGIKFENRRDSLINAFWDVLFVIIGALYVWIIKGIMVNLIGVHLILEFYIVGIVSFIVILIAFFIGRAMTK